MILVVITQPFFYRRGQHVGELYDIDVYTVVEKYQNGCWWDDDDEISWSHYL